MSLKNLKSLLQAIMEWLAHQLEKNLLKKIQKIITASKKIKFT